MTEYFKRFLHKNRQLVIILFTLGLTTLGYLTSLCLRFDFNFLEILDSKVLLLPVAILLVFRLGAYIFYDLNRGYWRYVSTYDLTRIIKAHFISSFLFAATVMFLRVPEFPRSIVLIELVLSIFLSGGSRFLVRLWCEKYLTESFNDFAAEDDVRDVLVLGGGSSGQLLVKLLCTHHKKQYRVVGVLDDSEFMQGTKVHGIPVIGTMKSIEDKLNEYRHVAAVILAMPNISNARLKLVESACTQYGVSLRKIQSVEDIACFDAHLPRTTLSIESVLEKETNIEHADEIREALLGKNVIVTGAGGSIGSELVRQILTFKPQRITLVDSSEYNLFKIERELRASPNEVATDFILADISDRSRMTEVFERFKPQYVFHAAAYKHVPLLEDNAYEAFYNNIIGTRTILECAKEVLVERFVMISTDKAVAPSSVMGASKRIAELLVRQISSTSSGESDYSMGTAVVRFGNVINSAGSVIPLFKEQILSGGPVTVTHPDMERFFMSIREAVHLVLTAGTLGSAGEVFILEMGKPIKIVDVAKKMLALYGRRDIPIVFSGLRPGEKLTEELTGVGEVFNQTRFNKVRKVIAHVECEVDVYNWVSSLDKSVHKLSNLELSKVIKSFATDDRRHEAVEAVKELRPVRAVAS